uniref:Uncharacterized protein n=1 Tax=Paramormyrops kingsleyae TaxID=1676925 RepID=A0A3B3QS77_9TELE
LATMKTGFVILLMTTTILSTSWGNYDLPSKPPCRPGFSESFYTVFVSRDILQGQSILKGKTCYLFTKYAAVLSVALHASGGRLTGSAYIETGARPPAAAAPAVPPHSVPVTVFFL